MTTNALYFVSPSTRRSLAPFTSSCRILLSSGSAEGERRCSLPLERNSNLARPHAHAHPSERARNVGTLRTWEYMAAHHPPQILLGDLNAEPDTDAMRFLSGSGELEGVRTHDLYDAWTALYEEPRPGKEYVSRNAASVPRRNASALSPSDRPLTARQTLPRLGSHPTLAPLAPATKRRRSLATRG